MFDFNEISPKTARLSGVLAQELNPQIYSSFAQPEHRGSQGQWEGGEWSPSTFIPLGHRWGDTQSLMLTGKPKLKELRTDDMSVSLPTQTDT